MSKYKPASSGSKHYFIFIIKWQHFFLFSRENKLFSSLQGKDAFKVEVYYSYQSIVANCITPLS